MNSPADLEAAAVAAAERPLDGGMIRVEGGEPLRGTVAIGGSKNAALPILAACLLTPDPCTIGNLPDIEDIDTMLTVLRALGASVERRDRHTVTVHARELTSTRVPLSLGRRMRASFLAVGPLLARLGRAEAPHPGGCDLGVRPVNVDVHGFQRMGAVVVHQDEYYHASAAGLRGERVYLDYPSHTGTENLLMAACGAAGVTTIRHASIEPEVADLAKFLQQMGARIEGVGTSTLVVEGGHPLRGAEYQVMPDRLAAGTFLIAGVISGGAVRVERVEPEHLDPVTYKLQEAGAHVEEGADWVLAGQGKPLQRVDLQAIHYPGFPTDLQAAFAALLTQAAGESLIHERVFENRFDYAAELRALGAHITVDASGQRARIVGPTRLEGGRTVRARDIRGGAAVVLAALAAEGETLIRDAYHVDRGYEDLVGTLAGLGARIGRVCPELSR